METYSSSNNREEVKEIGKLKSNGDEKGIDENKGNQTSRAICKISYKNKYCTGFFMNMDSFKLLITNYHIISEEMLNETIKIEMYNKKVKIINLDKNSRFIEFYKNPLDITVIQINDKDVIEYVDFLDYDTNYSQGYTQYNEENIFASGYPFGKNLVTVSGRITSVPNSYEFRHDIATDIGSSGSPIILLSNSKVIGVSKRSYDNFKIGTFIGIIIDKLQNLNNMNPKGKLYYCRNISY